jgi:hypothetical protein
MNNTDDILKKILLNMRYDTSKTLKENKLLLEEDKQYAMAWDGRTIVLPLNAVINGHNNHSKFLSYSISHLETYFPWWSEACKIHKPNEYGKCLNDYKIKWTSIVKDGSVRHFMIDGNQYKLGFIVHVPDKNNNPVLGTPANMKIVGYTDDIRYWTEYLNKSPKKTTESPKTGNNSLINKPGTEDGEVLITLDLDL